MQSQGNVQAFHSSEFGTIEILMLDGKLYFPAAECATILGYTKPHNAVERHCRYSLKRGVPHPQSPEKTIEKIFIPEGDLYRLIIRSKLPAAERFEHWVFDEVLPCIRKYGTYINDDTLDRMREDSAFTDELLRRLGDERAKNDSLRDVNDSLRDVINEQAPKVRYYDRILQCTSPVQTSIVAKDFGMSAVLFNKLLYKNRIQFKVGGTWLLYQKFANKGYTVTKTYLVEGRVASVHTCWTQKGRLFLYETLKDQGILPVAERDLDDVA